MKRQNEILLNAKQLEEKANILANVLNDISIIRDLIDFFPSVNDPKVQVNPIYHYRLVKKSLSNVFLKLQDIEAEIDDIAFILNNASHREELESMGLVLEELEEIG